MSREIFDAPTMVPAGSTIGEMLSHTWTVAPSFRTRRVSNGSPARMLSIATRSSSHRSSGMMSVMGLPIASAAV